MVLCLNAIFFFLSIDKLILYFVYDFKLLTHFLTITATRTEVVWQKAESLWRDHPSPSPGEQHIGLTV